MSLLKKLIFSNYISIPFFNKQKMQVISASEITNIQLLQLNISFNGNTDCLSPLDYSMWKSDLIKAGYTWNDLDGWGYWSVPGGGKPTAQPTAPPTAQGDSEVDQND